MKKKLAIIGTVALLGVGAVALSNQEWRANTIFATAKDKQLAWLIHSNLRHTWNIIGFG